MNCRSTRRMLPALSTIRLRIATSGIWRSSSNNSSSNSSSKSPWTMVYGPWTYFTPAAAQKTRYPAFSLLILIPVSVLLASGIILSRSILWCLFRSSGRQAPIWRDCAPGSKSFGRLRGYPGNNRAQRYSWFWPHLYKSTVL